MSTRMTKQAPITFRAAAAMAPPGGEFSRSMFARVASTSDSPALGRRWEGTGRAAGARHLIDGIEDSHRSGTVAQRTRGLGHGPATPRVLRKRAQRMRDRGGTDIAGGPEDDRGARRRQGLAVAKLVVG